MRSDQVTGLSPLGVLFEASNGADLPLPVALEDAYGRLAFNVTGDRPHVVANFVETLDGVVSLGVPGKAGGGPISGSNRHDRFVMGLLRSVADAVVVGVGTLRSVPDHIWTPEFIFPDLADEYAQLRSQLGKPPHPLNAIVTGSGDLDPDFAILKQTDVPVHVLTTAQGAATMGPRLQHVGRSIVAKANTIPAKDILRALQQMGMARLVLLETGPQLTSVFLAERALDELFLTLAPQVAGRDDSSKRPGLASGHLFAPDDPRWAKLVSMRRGDNHLFLRYSFTHERDSQGG
jgi:riboflavin biosynthesis pyrimidine reductase